MPTTTPEQIIEQRTNAALLKLVAIDDVETPEFNAGIAELQSIFGQTTGDIAAQHFAGQGEAWRSSDAEARLARLSAYLDAEFAAQRADEAALSDPWR